MLPRLHQKRLEAPLEQMPVLVPVLVETHREGGLQPAHAHGQVSQRRPEAQMIVVAHQAIRGQFPIELPARLLQGFHERLLRPFGFEYIRAIVASVYNMIKTVARFKTPLSRHGLSCHPRRGTVKLTIDH